MLIGELAQRSGVSPRSLRYYEAHGLIAARRDANGYRVYGEQDVRLAREIGTLLAHGFSLRETQPFIECLKAGNTSGDSCPESLAIYRRKLAELDATIDRLRAVRDEMAAQLSQLDAAPACEFTAFTGEST